MEIGEEVEEGVREGVAAAAAVATAAARGFGDARGTLLARAGDTDLLFLPRAGLLERERDDRVDI